MLHCAKKRSVQHDNRYLTDVLADMLVRLLDRLRESGADRLVQGWHAAEADNDRKQAVAENRGAYG